MLYLCFLFKFSLHFTGNLFLFSQSRTKIKMWKDEMTRAWDKEKTWVPDGNQTHELPNTRPVLYIILSYKNSWRGSLFNWVHIMTRVVYTVRISTVSSVVIMTNGSIFHLFSFQYQKMMCAHFYTVFVQNTQSGKIFLKILYWISPTCTQVSELGLHSKLKHRVTRSFSSLL